MNIFFEKTLYIYTSSSLHNEMLKIMFEKKFKKIKVLDSLEFSQKILQNDAIWVLDDTDENHDNITEFLKNHEIAKNCLILIDCHRKHTIRNFIFFKIGGLISYKTAFTELNKGIESIARDEIYFSERIKDAQIGRAHV